MRFPFQRSLERFIERKASQFGPLIVQRILGRAAWPDRDITALLREGYRQNPIVYRGVRMVAEAAASIPWVLYDGDNEVDEHPMLDLLEKPNPLQDGDSLLVAWYSYLQTAGTTYMEAVTGVGNEPQELYVLRPDRMRIVPGPDALPRAFDYTVNGQTRRVPVDYAKGEIPILHMRTFHPLDDWYGMSPLDPAAFAIDTNTGAAAYNKALLDNSAQPSGAFIVGGKGEGDDNLTEDQRQSLKKEFKSKKPGDPWVLEGGITWQQFAMTMRDMQFSESKQDSAREICFTLGVPPMILGIPGDNTYTNYKEANTALWKQTVIPLARRGASGLGGWLGPKYGNPNLRLDIDLDAIDALAEERASQWERVDNTTFLKINEKREATGYEPVGPEGDVILVDATKLPLGTDTGDNTGDTTQKDEGNGGAGAQ